MSATRRLWRHGGSNEHDVCAGAARQLRCVDDALAWKVFDYQRNFIAVLSPNAPPGPMAGKLGLIAERRFLTEIWHGDGHFALLHDRTWCLRIGDATLFTPGMIELREIKTNENHQRSAQKRRINEAAEALRSHTPMPGGVGQVLVEIDLPYTNHLEKLRDLLDLASRRTLQSMKIPAGRAMTAVNMFAGELAPTEQESADRFSNAFESVKRRARIAPPEQLVKCIVDMVSGSSVAPPWAAYPATRQPVLAHGSDRRRVRPHYDTDTSDSILRCLRWCRFTILGQSPTTSPSQPPGSLRRV